MGLWDYHKSREIDALDPSFASLVMAAARKADTENFERLKMNWPGTIQEFEARYNAPGGVLPND